MTEFTIGLSRDVAFQAHLPSPVVEQQVLDSGRVSRLGFNDPSLLLKWRFWDKDEIGRKLAAAAMVRSTLPLQGSAPVLTTGISQGMESLEWYYFVDGRARLSPSAIGARTGTRLYADLAGGWRPYLHGLDDTDVVLFLEANYEHRFADDAGGTTVNDTGGDFVFLSPEILASPSNRVMFKTGLQLPLLQFPRGKQQGEPVRIVFETEFRF